MRNRAKCKLCDEVIESMFLMDYVTCKCGEISICGGTQRFESGAKDYKNFLRVTDEDKEVPVQFLDESQEQALIKNKEDEGAQFKIGHKDKEGQIAHLISHIEKLPAEAMSIPLNHYDLLLLLRLISEKE